jgi:hypothetical protein
VAEPAADQPSAASERRAKKARMADAALQAAEAADALNPHAEPEEPTPQAAAQPAADGHIYYEGSSEESEPEPVHRKQPPAARVLRAADERVRATESALPAAAPPQAAALPEKAPPQAAILEREFSLLPELEGAPAEGAVLAYRLLEMGADMSPCISEPRLGVVASYDEPAGTLTLDPCGQWPGWAAEGGEQPGESCGVTAGGSRAPTPRPGSPAAYALWALTSLAVCRCRRGGRGGQGVSGAAALRRARQAGG